MDKRASIVKALESSMDYRGYIDLIEKLHQEEKATSFQDDPTFFEYSRLSLTRMKRIHKRFEIPEEALAAMSSIQSRQTWMLITESWCGDASQTVPIIVRLSEQSELVDLRIVLRDSEPEVMDHYLTNGGRSIPMLVMFDEDLNESGRWGPRPRPAQKMFLDHREEPKETRMDSEEFKIVQQKWYNKDKGRSTISELLDLF